MGRVTRSSAQNGRLLWTAVAIGVALVVALGMVVADLADTAEVVATLLLAAVAVTALWAGRYAGLGVALAAAAVYAGLRVGDVDGVGAAGVAVLVLARGAVFAAVGWFTPVVAPLLPGLAPRPAHRASVAPGERAPSPSPASALAELGDSRGSHFPGGEPGPVLGYGGADEPSSDAWGPRGGGWDTADGDEDWDDDGIGVPLAPQWEEPLTPPTETWGEAPPPLGAPAGGYGADGHDAAGGYVPAGHDGGGYEPVAWDHPTDPGLTSGNGGHHPPGEVDGDHEGVDHRIAGAMVPEPAWSPGEPEPGDWDQYGQGGPPQLPTGWQDDTELAQDQTIPVGYTGELFLPPDLSLAGSPVTAEPHPAGNGWTGPGDRPAPPGYPTHDPAARAGTGAMPPGRPDQGSTRPPPSPPVPGSPVVSRVDVAGTGHTPTQDPETRLWNARFFRERLTVEVEAARQAGVSFSVVLVQVPDEPFRALPYRRQVALLRELGHQFVAAGVVDHLVHLPDGDRHWFAVILGETDRPAAQEFEQRLRSAIGGYLRHRGLQVHDIESASMTSPDDDQLMADVWASLLGSPPASDPARY